MATRNAPKLDVAKQESTKKRDPRPQPERVHIDTRLYVKKDEGLLLQIYALIDEKIYTQTFRDAFRLVLSLRRRETSVLFELFPWLTEGHLNTTQLNYVNYLVERVRELEGNDHF
jgi:hypothetical protein